MLPQPKSTWLAAPKPFRSKRRWRFPCPQAAVQYRLFSLGLLCLKTIPYRHHRGRYPARPATLSQASSWQKGWPGAVCFRSGTERDKLCPCRELQAADSWQRRAWQCNAKRLAPSTEVPFGPCLPAPGGQAPSYGNKMCPTSLRTPMSFVMVFPVPREMRVSVGPVLCPPFVSRPSKDPFNFQPPCPPINCLCSVLGGVPTPSSLGRLSSVQGVFLIICLDLRAASFHPLLGLFLSHFTLPQTHSASGRVPLRTWCATLACVLCCNLPYPPPPHRQSPRKPERHPSLPKPYTSAILLPSAPTCSTQAGMSVGSSQNSGSDSLLTPPICSVSLPWTR